MNSVCMGVSGAGASTGDWSGAWTGIAQSVLWLATLVALVKPLGWFMARVLEGRAGRTPLGLGAALGWLERGLLRLAGVRLTREGVVEEMTWKTYAWGVLVFNALGCVLVYAIQRLQGGLPLNPAGLGAVEPSSAFNTAISFVSNTNWQGYGGETTMSFLTQMLGLGVQNFLSAATGIAVLAALIRGLARREASTIGNCWSDLIRVTLYILLPMSAILAIVLVGQGVVQSFEGPRQVALIAPVVGPDGATATTQVIPLGPAASQIAIKQLGTNGGGFFNANSAHPFENPTAMSNFLECLAILLLPAALCWTYGDMVRDRRQGWALLTAMFLIFTPLLAVTQASEASGNPARGLPVAVAGVGNMEGKEARFGVAASALWASATTAASNGSVNAMHDSFMPLGGLAPMWLMQLGEVVFGGVGSGLYGMLMFVIVAVFVAGLMVGRAPEYLGKKIEPFEMKMAAICILVPCGLTLAGAAVAVMTQDGRAGVSNPGPHGFSQVLYAASSAANNNGSAFAGLSANTPFYNTLLGVLMWFSRFWLIIPTLAVAGSMAAKRATPASAGTLPTHTPVFVGMLAAVVIIVGALTFVPALALGPVVEALRLAHAG